MRMHQAHDPLRELVSALLIEVFGIPQRLQVSAKEDICKR